VPAKKKKTRKKVQKARSRPSRTPRKATLADMLLTLQKMVNEIDGRLRVLEGSDFAVNRERFDRYMRELEEGMPGIPMPP